MKSNPLIPVSDVLTTKFPPFNQHMINFITFLGIFCGWGVCVYLYTSSISLFFLTEKEHTLFYIYPPPLCWKSSTLVHRELPHFF